MTNKYSFKFINLSAWFIISLLFNNVSAQTVTTMGSGFTNPYDVAVDNNGNIYVADYGNSKVKKMDSSGGGISIINSGTIYPSAVTVDTNGNIYVLSIGDGTLRKITPSNTETTLFTIISQMTDIQIDSNGNIYIVDFGNNVIKKFDSNGANPSILGSGFLNPGGIAFDASGNIYVADYGHNAIKKMNASGNNITTLASGLGGPYGIALDSNGNIYFSEAATGNVKKMNNTGGGISTIASGLTMPAGLCIDNVGNIYVADLGGSLIKKITFNLSINETKNTSFLIYPNPAKDYVTISNIKRGAMVSLYEATGKLLFSTKSNDANITINTSNFKTGMYLVSVDGQTSKLIISK